MAGSFPKNLRITRDTLAELRLGIAALVADEVLVGVPEESTERAPGDPVTNASLALIHDQGAPEANIPARPFMRPGIGRAVPAVAEVLAATAQRVLEGGGKPAVDRGNNAAGLIAQLAIQNLIRQGIAPPLAEYTLRRRANRGGKGLGGRQGAQQELDNRAAGLAPSTDLAKPLIDTGELLKSITYVVRPRAARGK